MDLAGKINFLITNFMDLQRLVFTDPESVKSQLSPLSSIIHDINDLLGNTDIEPILPIKQTDTLSEFIQLLLNTSLKAQAALKISREDIASNYINILSRLTAPYFVKETPTERSEITPTIDDYDDYAC